MTSTDWMDRESARIADAKRLAEELGQRQLAASMTAQQGAPEYWKQFVDEVKSKQTTWRRNSPNRPLLTRKLSAIPQ